MSVPNHPPACRRRAGFTLVELLVVIGIIALLIGILLPTLSRARQSANAVACLSNMRQLGQATTFFVNEHDGWTPKGWWNNGPDDRFHPKAGWSGPQANENPPWRWVAPQWGWDMVMLSYTDTKEVFRCPGDPSNMMRGEGDDGNPPESHPDGDPLQNNIPASYGYNSSNNATLWHSYRISQVPNATKSILLFEKAEQSPIHHLATWWGVNHADIAAIEPDFPDNLAKHRHGSDQADGDNTDPKQYNKRRLNYLFLDGHGEAVTWEETWKVVEGESAVIDGTKYLPSMWRQRYPTVPTSYRHGGPWNRLVGQILPNSDKFEAGDLYP